MNEHDLHDKRAYRTAMNERIFRENHLGIDRFFALDQAAYRDGALDSKTKELLGLVASLVLRCNDCVLYHLDRCVQEGVTHEQIVETLNIGLVVGGSIVIPHLRFAFEMMDQLEQDAGGSP